MTRRTRWLVPLLFGALASPLAAMQSGGDAPTVAGPSAAARDAATGPATIDGPYVLLRDGVRTQLRLQRSTDGDVEVVREAVLGGVVDVETDAPTPRRFRVPLRDAHPRAAVEWPQPSRLFVASDFEGRFDAFVRLLQAQGVLDDGLHWRYGDGGLVLVGDLVDRGPDVLPLLWLVYRLEAEAQAAGGRLHYLLGNHEQMLLQGNGRDAHPKYVATLQASGETTASLWDERSELGRWLRSKPVLLKVGTMLFLHGGVSPDVLALQPTLAEVDRHAASIALPSQAVADARARALLWDRAGVLWYRGLAMDLEGLPKQDVAHVDAVLRHFDVAHVVIGHTLARAVGSDYDGRVLRVDVLHAEGTVEGLLVEGEALWRVDADGGRHPLAPARNLE